MRILGSAETVLRNVDGIFKSGPAHVIVKALVEGRKPSEFEINSKKGFQGG